MVAWLNAGWYGLVIPVVSLLMHEGGARLSEIQPLSAFLNDFGKDVLVVGALGALVLVYIIKNLYLAFLYRKQTSFAYGVQASLSFWLFDNYLKQPYVFHLQRNSAQLIRNA